MKKISFLLVLILLFLACFMGCTPYIMPNDTTEAINGLYINDKGELFCIIHGTTITVSRKTKASAANASAILSDVFEFALDNGTYYGSNAEKTISFKLNGDKLNLKSEGKTYSLLLDRSILFDDKIVEVNKPNNISIQTSQISWYWKSEEFNNPYESGILNACIEITSTKNELIKCEHIDYNPEPAAMFSYDLKNMKLAPGEYNLSVKYVGGMHFKNDSIYQSLDSETVTFALTVTEDNEYVILWEVSVY